MTSTISVAVQQLDNSVKETMVSANFIESHYPAVLLNNYNTLELALYMINHRVDNNMGEYTQYANMDEYLKFAKYQSTNYIWTEFDDIDGNRTEGWMVKTDADEFKELI